jgi:hypothetical protein
MRMSCKRAITAAKAKENSKRKEIKMTMMRSATAMACRACARIWPPNVGLMLVALTSAPSSSSNACRTSVFSSCESTGVRTS